MSELAREIRDQYAQLPDYGSDVEISGESVTGHWDQGSMRRAIKNLVNNAIKYGNGGAIKIMAQQTRGRMMLTVHNEGQPMPEDRRNPFFEYLRREDGASGTDG